MNIFIKITGSGQTLYSADRAIWWSSKEAAKEKAFATNAPQECPKCGEPALKPQNIYYEGGEDGYAYQWTEYKCDCGHYLQSSKIDHDFDPSPDDQESVTRIGGWG